MPTGVWVEDILTDNPSRYLGRLPSGNAFRLERLAPGPFGMLKPPMLTVPITSPSPDYTTRSLRNPNSMLLTLYYRSALQVLSAFQFMHSRSVFMNNLASWSVWLRPIAPPQFMRAYGTNGSHWSLETMTRPPGHERISSLRRCGCGG